ncbi:MAG TPA: 5'/3'-nucleotidase SurE, partial [Kiloniellales bacterium]|nr:5'/3'-nucleotidase SurE [Kiloniellales bacterium]
MHSGPLALDTARVLVTNDDGIHAPGLEVLERIARSLSRDVWVVAPETEQSATSHALTLRRPLRLRERAAQRYSVDGTPTDCVLVAHQHLLRDHPPDIVLSGINHGANLGEDVHYSGTVAAALEAALLGSRAVAFSQMRSGGEIAGWETAERFAPVILERLAKLDWP